MLLSAQSFEFVFQAELFLFEFRDSNLIAGGVRHLSVDKLLQFLMFISDFPDMSLYGHRIASQFQGYEIRPLIKTLVTSRLPLNLPDRKPDSHSLPNGRPLPETGLANRFALAYKDG
jgi:hypothetical protein